MGAARVSSQEQVASEEGRGSGPEERRRQLPEVLGTRAAFPRSLLRQVELGPRPPRLPTLPF